MPNTFIKPSHVVDAAALLLQREIVLPRTVAMMPIGEFRGKLNDTVTRRVPAVLTASSRTMRSTTGLAAQDLTETSVPVQLTDHIYQLLNLTDEQLTLDISDLSTQVLQPQMRAVAEGLEDVIAAAIAAATWTATDVAYAEATDDPYEIAVDARKALNDLDVPRGDRVLLLGSAVESAFLKSDRISKVNESGSDSALREAIIGRVAGFTLVGSNAIGPNEAYAYHRNAFVFVSGAPVVPAGASQGATVTSEGMSMRYLRDYDPTNATGPVDRSLVDSFVGCSSTDDANGGTENQRGVAIAFTPAP